MLLRASLFRFVDEPYDIDIATVDFIERRLNLFAHLDCLEVLSTLWSIRAITFFGWGIHIIIYGELTRSICGRFFVVYLMYLLSKEVLSTQFDPHLFVQFLDCIQSLLHLKYALRTIDLSGIKSVSTKKIILILMKFLLNFIFQNHIPLLTLFIHFCLYFLRFT